MPNYQNLPTLPQEEINQYIEQNQIPDKLIDPLVKKLSPYRQSQPQERILGRLRGQFTVPNNFNEPDEELIRLFEGEED